jgi:hypothetical protein
MKQTSAIRKPYKQDADKGTVRVELRLTPKQAEQLSSKVEQTNLTTAAYIRQRIGVK